MYVMEAMHDILNAIEQWGKIPTESYNITYLCDNRYMSHLIHTERYA